MNRFAYLTSGFAIKALSRLSKARIFLHGEKNIPRGPTIFVINHFTRIETLLLPAYIYHLTGIPVWSLADASLFRGALGKYLDHLGAVSTRAPDRDRIIVKSLLTGEAHWIIFPEGLMVKTKKIFEKGHFMVGSPRGKHRPHTGPAALGLRTEFYRQRILDISGKCPDEAKRLLDMFNMDSIESVSEKTTYIVPVNLTYYPIRARENIISTIAGNLVGNLPDRAIEEIMIEGTMLLSGVDIDIRFGRPIRVSAFIRNSPIEQDISADNEINFDDPLPSKKMMQKVALKMTRTYMSGIYSMTTVNHDHLFASVLRLMPFKKIRKNDLIRRVFLAATHNLGKKRVYHHTSLNADQVHLLTDDRYGKFKDFIAIALEKGVVQEDDADDSLLIRNTSEISKNDFHRVRVDDPISVMANEVEPLTLLQRQIRRLAWLPESQIRRMVVRCLLAKSDFEFEQDYETFHVEGETKDKAVGRPFLLRGASDDMGVVLVHGYMAAPLEVRSLAEYLTHRGLWVCCPRLRGHGTSPEDLATRTYEDWVESVDAAYALVSNVCKQVVVGGFSTGAALALELATRVGGAKGVFAVCPPMRLQDFAARFAPAMDTWNRLMRAVRFDSARKAFVQNTPENPHINYSRNPISGVKEIERLMNDLEPKLSRINVPVLVSQSCKDPVVNHKGSRRIFQLLGSENKQYILFNFERHGILLGKDAHKVHEAIWDFIKYL